MLLSGDLTIPSRFEGEVGVLAGIDLSNTGLSSLVIYGINLFFLANLTLCFLYLVWGGFQLITSGGTRDTKRIMEGMAFAGIGLVVSIIALVAVGAAGKSFNQGLGLPGR